MSNLDKICALIYHLNRNTSNLVLQKLLYLIQAYSLVVFNKPAFEENIEAWMYGPVVPEAYYKVKADENYYREKDSVGLDQELSEAVQKIVRTFEEVSPFVLVDMTHSYDPWKNAWEKGGWNTNISNDEIKNYHIQRIRKEDGRIF